MAHDPLHALHDLASQVEHWLEAHAFDGFGLAMSGLDAATGRPFEPGQISVDLVPRRAAQDPWAYWTYEDSIMCLGLFLEARVIQHQVTGEDRPLIRARQVAEVIRQVYYASQVHGHGAFLRPYRAFDGLDAFAEPLGTDQASPMLAGMVRLLPYLNDDLRTETQELLVNTLDWYARQGYRYWYYKSMMHAWHPPLHHAGSYYLPALAHAAQVSPAPRWRADLERYLERQFADPTYTQAATFLWGGDLLTLHEFLPAGLRQRTFTADFLGHLLEEVRQKLLTYNEPGGYKRQHPASAHHGFVAHMRPGFDRHKSLGYAYFSTVHGGLTRPTQELATLCALADLGVPEALPLATDWLAKCQRLPGDFVPFVAADPSHIHHHAQLYFRSVGPRLFLWWRDYWRLRHAHQQAVG